MRDDLLLYYERELTYLRKMGVLFAEKHPKVASRLALEPTKCEDPHVERLLEAFAFLAARVHLKIDDEFPEITQGLLNVVYPQLVRPVPSMSVVQFQVDPEKGKLTSGVHIDKGSPLYSRPVAGVPCTFQTCYDTTLWPLSVAAAEWRLPSGLKPTVRAPGCSGAIRLELRCAADNTFQDLKINELRLYLHGEGGLVNTIYELLCGKVEHILVRDASPNSPKPPVTLPSSSIRPVGFAKNESMLPNTHTSFIGHYLLLEYFAFPEKFFFLDLVGLEKVWAAGFTDAIEIIFLISNVAAEDRRQRLELEVSKDTFRLGCAPVVNLFPQTAEPVQITQRKYEYPIVPDVRRPYATEVYSVDEVNCINSGTDQITTLTPFYALKHSARTSKEQCFWLTSRRQTTRVNDEGTDVSISLLDLSMQQMVPEGNVLSIRTTCTNRDLPSRLPFGNPDGDFELEGFSSLKAIMALRKPTAPVRPPTGKGTLWRLVSHLSLNYLSLVNEGKEALQQILRVYDIGRTAYSQNIIESILRVQSQPHFARVFSDNGVAFARGRKIELELDEDRFVGGGAFLFASVLEQFLALNSSLNSFTQLTVTTPQRKEVLHEWQPRAGRKVLI